MMAVSAKNQRRTKKVTKKLWYNTCKCFVLRRWFSSVLFCCTSKGSKDESKDISEIHSSDDDDVCWWSERFSIWMPEEKGSFVHEILKDIRNWKKSMNEVDVKYWCSNNEMKLNEIIDIDW